MYEKEIRRILLASQNNALTFFVGAGISAISSAPNWKELIDKMCIELGKQTKEKYSSDEYLKIPQIYYYSIGKNDKKYNEFVKSIIKSEELMPNIVHNKMLDLNPVSFITTNYDTLIENAATHRCKSYKVISCDKDVPKIFGDKYILKVHGDFIHDNFVLKEEDYLNYSENFKLIETLTKSIFSTNTIVFIGYSLNDNNIKLILNWAKSLLNDRFINPIFIYTGNEKLSKEELIYHESRGLSVIEYNNLIPETDDYEKRYLSVFDTISKQSAFSIEGKTEVEVFEILYNLLKPLDDLDALRIEDVSRRLYPFVNISVSGEIFSSSIFEYFMSIHNSLKNDNSGELPDEILNKYNCVLRVLKKARISTYVQGNDAIKLFEHIPFADENCLSLDYLNMRKIASRTYHSVHNNYKKAFFLSRLCQYDEAFMLFSEIAKEAFQKRNYLLYYFSQVNCIVLKKVVKRIDSFYKCYDLHSIDSLTPNTKEIEELFNNLPVEFKKDYESLKNIHSPNFLYEYFYMAYVDGQKTKDAIDKQSIEFGLTSSDKTICTLNDYLHFLLGNGLTIDIFDEYRNAVKNLMSILLYKYSKQGKQVLNQPKFPFSRTNDICFDEIDFYSFIQYFSDKEIRDLFNKYQVKTIEFNHMDLVEKAVNNIIDYYESMVSSKNGINLLFLQKQIKTCLVLLRYVSISQKLVNRICKFIFKYDFSEIMINDKIMFLDYQISRRKMFSEETAGIIEDTLISYIDKQITASINGTNFDVFSSSSGINYPNLVHYIYPSNKKWTSRRLSMRVSKILSNNISKMYYQVYRNYVFYLSDYQRKRIITWANKQLKKEFDYELFKLLIVLGARIRPSIIKDLCGYLKNKTENINNNPSGIKTYYYPESNPFEELEEIGYWCFLGDLCRKDFAGFVGISDQFDSYYYYEDFDYDKFDVSWLLKFTRNNLQKIASDEMVREKIRLILASQLMSESIESNDEKALQKILLAYFC